MSPKDIEVTNQIKTVPHSNKTLTRKLSEADMVLAESVQSVWMVTPPNGTTRDTMLPPIFWAHVARKLRPMAMIWACPKDGTWYGQYLVLYADEHQAKVNGLRLAGPPCVVCRHWSLASAALMASTH